jgi:hypothetical protein
VVTPPVSRVRVGESMSRRLSDSVERLLRNHARLGANHFLLRVPWAGMPQEQVLKAIELFGRARHSTPVGRVAARWI